MSREDSKRQPAAEQRKEGRYANVFQIGHNAFEVILEFGQHEGGIHTRIVMSPQHARILSDLLIDTVRQHENMLSPPPKGGTR